MMRFRVYRNRYGNFYAKRQVWIFWCRVVDGYTECTVVKDTKDEMIKYLYDRFLKWKKIYDKDELVADFRI